MSALAQNYRYQTASKVQTSDEPRLFLAGTVENDETLKATYFSGEIVDSQRTALCLIAVSDLVGKRFYTPPSMLARILREADPVITVHEQSLRFEGFSACCSAYMRFDIDRRACSIESNTFGTTNVDFGAETRAALSQVTAKQPLNLLVSSDGFELATDTSCVFEKKVELPVRWIKGFAEVQIHQSQMTHCFSLKRIQVLQFLRALPRSASDHLQWVSVAGSKTRISMRPSANAVGVRGIHRLQVIERLASYCDYVDVYFNETLGSSAWVMSFADMRVCTVLNGEPWQGFSGDGLLLPALATKKNSVSKQVLAQLKWQSSLDLDLIAKNTNSMRTDIDDMLPSLMANGMIGFDLHHDHYFHRQLPFDYKSVSAINPRLKAAQKLVDSRCVTQKESIGADVWDVTSSGTSYRVERKSHGFSCTCPWFMRHRMKKGPCKHILAITIDQGN